MHIHYANDRRQFPVVAQRKNFVAFVPAAQLRPSTEGFAASKDCLDRDKEWFVPIRVGMADSKNVGRDGHFKLSVDDWSIGRCNAK
jgi:hypothetical protein